METAEFISKHKHMFIEHMFNLNIHELNSEDNRLFFPTCKTSKKYAENICVSCV
jgi:hypothetical protein